MTEYDDSYEYGEEPNWKGETQKRQPASKREHDFELNVGDFINNCVINITKFNLLVPFAHDPTLKYVGAIIHKDSNPGFSKKWMIEGRENRFDSAMEATDFAAFCIEAERSRMIDEEFKKSGI